MKAPLEATYVWNVEEVRWEMKKTKVRQNMCDLNKPNTLIHMTDCRIQWLLIIGNVAKLLPWWLDNLWRNFLLKIIGGSWELLRRNHLREQQSSSFFKIVGEVCDSRGCFGIYCPLFQIAATVTFASFTTNLNNLTSVTVATIQTNQFQCL